MERNLFHAERCGKRTAPPAAETRFSAKLQVLGFQVTVSRTALQWSTITRLRTTIRKLTRTTARASSYERVTAKIIQDLKAGMRPWISHGRAQPVPLRQCDRAVTMASLIEASIRSSCGPRLTSAVINPPAGSPIARANALWRASSLGRSAYHYRLRPGGFVGAAKMSSLETKPNTPRDIPLVDRIDIPPYGRFVDTPTSTAAESYCSTLFHEITHDAALWIVPHVFGNGRFRRIKPNDSRHNSTFNGRTAVAR